MNITNEENATEQERIVRYWHAVELLQPQSAPPLKKRDNHYSAFIHDTPISRPVTPWSTASITSKQRLPKRFIWSHTLFAHIYDSRKVAEQLKHAFGADQGYREPQFRTSALFAARFTMDGMFADDSFVLSSEAWFLGRVLSGKDWSTGFKEAQDAVSEYANVLLNGEVSGEALCALTQMVVQTTGIGDFFGDMHEQKFRFRSQPVNPKKEQVADDPLNSFLLDDLIKVADSIGGNKISKPLDQFLSLHDERDRLHIGDDHSAVSIIERLMPDSYPISCWPSKGHLGLVHSQQLAINSSWASLNETGGLLGINGPPGTGKTTLLRDLIAAIVTSRADELANLDRASDAFVLNGRETANDEGKQQACFRFNPALFGFEIVVASSNNSAVENVTHELPQRDTVDESWLPDAEYFPELGELVSGKPAWGLISGALGSKTRRNTFIQGYFYGKRPYEDKNIKNQKSKVDSSTDTENELGDDAEIPISETDEPSDTDADQAESHPEKELKGLFTWLNECAEANKVRTTEQRRDLWKIAVNDYEIAKAEVREICFEANELRELIRRLCYLRNEIREKSEALSNAKSRLAETVDHLTQLDEEECRPANRALKESLDALEQHRANQPSFWAKLITLWQAQRNWASRQPLLKDQYDLSKSEFERITRQVKQLETLQQKLEIRVTDLERALRESRIESRQQKVHAEELAETYGAKHILIWLQEFRIVQSDEIELAEPWRIKGLRQARAKVFIQALKLHQTFFELEASRLRSNLFFINRILGGSDYQGISHDAIRSAWASLFMFVPVLSSTFSSFARSFGSLDAEEIGWLLVDEAGQAPPQAAVGALWRSKRALLVGDPLQLKPIVTVSDAVLEHMRTRYQVDTHWLPNQLSAQTLADNATTWGRMAGPPDGKCWVGLPLIVHRRCDRPMYELANRIAYDHSMVFGTVASSSQNDILFSHSTGWVQVSGASEGNWVKAEGKALEQLLEQLEKDGVSTNDISVITPFKAVNNNLRRLLDEDMVFGTIHTMQGKEAKVIILVLGGNTATPGARNWVVSEPNLLNVAATRAKQRLYVIGDRNDWKNRALFCDVMDLLPLIILLPNELEQLPLTPSKTDMET